VSSRTLAWLAGGLVVLVLLAVVGQRRTAPSDPETAGTTFLPALMDSLEQVDGITVVGAGDMPIATLERDADGWTVQERDGYPADLTKVRHTLLTLAEANVLEIKTANPQLHSMLGVEDVAAPDATGVAVTLRGVTPPVTIVVGEAAGDYRRYVRRDGENQSFLINRDPEVGTMPAAWLDTTVIDLPSARVRAVTVTHPDGEIVRVSKATRDQPNFTVENIPEGRTLLYDSVANVMASVLQDLTLEDVERDTGATDEEIVTQITTFDGVVITARGLQGDEGHWLAFAFDTTGALPETDADPDGGANGESAIADTDADTDADADTDTDAESSEPADPAAEAETLNERLGGWRFRIPAYKFDQLTRSMDDLLQAPPQ
jgi:hypothetical protein